MNPEELDGKEPDNKSGKASSKAGVEGRAAVSDRIDFVLGQPLANSDDGFLQPGIMVDHFLIKRLIGRGGMGEVYLARDTRLGRRVALKIIHRENLGHEKSVARFLLEARTTARFNHPHIVTIFAVGEHDGSPYLALEYLEGSSLRERMDRERPSLREIIRVGLAVAGALQEAHRHRILHRDLKPENVIIPKDGRLRVVDFGLAKSLQTGTKAGDPVSSKSIDSIDSAQDTELCININETIEKGFYGTPAYMSPEQWKQKSCSEASDMWSFGVMLYELLAGRRPFGEETHPLALAMQICESTELPSIDIYRDIPEELGDLVDRCLSKRPEDRPPAQQAVKILERILSKSRNLPDENISPFRGLMVFDERHADLFFGREADVDSLVELLRTQPVLPLVGPSGSGKSSLVQAGVIPRLREQARWLVISMRPGNTPIKTLSERIAAGLSTSGRKASVSFPGPRSSYSSLPAPEETGDNDSGINEFVDGMNQFAQKVDQINAEILENPEILNLELQKLAEKTRTRVLLFVDQMEEVFALVEDEKTRRSFLEAICLAADDPTDPVRVIFTLRDDFLGRLASGRIVAGALSRVSVVRSPERSELKRIISQPLEVFGYRYEDPEMVEEMLDEVMDDTVNLPILQFTCRSLWNRRDPKRKILTRAAFKEIGGVGGALVSHADGVLKSMSPQGISAARHVFIRLVTADGTRRTATGKELLESIGQENGQILERLVSARLITVRGSHDKGIEDNEYELIHESLIHRWRTLRRWLEESREDRHFLEQVGQAAALWETRGCRNEEVWEGPALVEALKAAERCESPLPEKVSRFLNASLERDKSKKLRKKVVLAGVLIILVAIAFVSTTAAFKWREKEREVRLQRDRAQTAGLLAEKRSVESQISGARASFARGDVLEARALLRSSMTRKDSLVGRALWWELSRLPLLWNRNINVPIYQLKWSPCGKKIAAASRAESLHVFDGDTAQVKRLRGMREAAFALDFSPDGDSLIVGTPSGSIWFWNLQTGESTEKSGHDSAVWGVAWSPGGKHAASGGGDGDILLWNPSNLESEPRKWEIKKRISRITFSPDGSFIFAAGMDGNIHVLKLEDSSKGGVLRPHSVLEGITSAVSEIAVSPEGGFLAAAARDGTVPVWDLNTKKIIQKLRGHGSRVNTVAFSADGRYLASGSVDKKLVLWDTRTWQKIRTFQGHDGPIWTVSFSSLDGRIASGGRDHTVRVWRIPEHARPAGPEPHRAEVVAVVCHPETNLIASAGQDDRILLWNKETGLPEDGLEGHEGNILSLALSPDGRFLVSGSQDATVRIWDIAARKQVHNIKAHSQGVHAVAVSPDGKTIASAGTDRIIRLFDLNSGKQIGDLHGHTNSIWSLAFAPDGETLASGSWDNTIRIWNIPSLSKRESLHRQNRPVHILEGHSANIWGLRFTTDGKRLYSGSWDGTLRSWDPANGKIIEIVDVKTPINSIDIDSEGDRIVAGLQGGELMLQNRESVIRFRAHRGDINKITLCGAPPAVLSVSDDNTVRLHNLNGVPAWNLKAFLHGNQRLSFATHTGWTDLHVTADRLSPLTTGYASSNHDGVADRVNRNAENSLERHLDEFSLWAEYESSGKVCVLRHDHKIEALNTQPFKRIFLKSMTHSPAETKIRSFFSTPWGCALHANTFLALYKWDGTHAILSENVEAVTHNEDHFIFAYEGKMKFVDYNGDVLKEQTTSKDIVTLFASGEGYLVGYRDGSVELLPTVDNGEKTGSIVFEGSPGSSVTVFATGMKDLLFAGFENGSIAIWSMSGGNKLLRSRIHGSIRHFAVQGRHLHVFSDLGNHEAFDLSVFHLPYKSLVREIKRKVSVVWMNGRAVSVL